MKKAITGYEYKDFLIAEAQKAIEELLNNVENYSEDTIIIIEVLNT